MAEQLKRLAFTGYYGQRNFGDDLFGAACLQAARRYWPNTLPTLVSPAYFRAAFLTESAAAKLYAHDGLSGKCFRFATAMAALLRNDAIILGGGSILASNSSRARALQYAIGRKTGAVFAGVGVSVGPFESTRDEEKTARMLREFAFLSVRDQESRRLTDAMDLGYEVVLGGDLAALYPPPAERRSWETATKAIAFVPCNFAQPGDARDARRVRELHQAMLRDVATVASERNLQVRLLALNNHPLRGDDVLVREAAEVLGRTNIDFAAGRAIELGIDGTWRALASASAVVSARLHGAIPSYLNGTPFALLEYHRKCADFVVDVGQHCKLRISPEERLGMVKVLEVLLDNPPPPTLVPAQYRQRAEDAFRAAPFARHP